MGTTTRGYRYPDSNGFVGNVPQYVADLAADVDTKIGRAERGIVTLNIGATGTPVTQAVSFATAFPAGPVVQVTIINPSSNAPQNFACGAASVSTTGFTIIGVRTAGAAATLQLHWLAVG